MKKTRLIFLFCLMQLNMFSQSTFDKSLNEISVDIADKLSNKAKKKVVVLYVTDINKSQTVAGKYIADVISVNIVNNPGNFEVFDRENLSGIAEAKKLLAEGYIDASGAKEIGKILSVDAIVIGNYTVLSNTLKLTLKALDVNNGFVIAATMKDLPLNSDAGSLLGINVGTESPNNTNRGFNNRPMGSNEQYNNPETVNKECATLNCGDYCFTNSTNKKIAISIGNKYRLILNPEQTQCIYNVKAGTMSYFYFEDSGSTMRKGPVLGQGEILIEICKSKTQFLN